MLAVIGDVHGKTKPYLELTKRFQDLKCKTFQVGDMGFDYGHMAALDPKIHKFMLGNHDNTVMAGECTNNVGRFGYLELEGCPSFFFVSGGFSIDKAHRSVYVDWFPDEELSYRECEAALKLYCEIKPKLLISHEPPFKFGRTIDNGEVLISYGFDPNTFQTKTSTILQQMIDAYAPDISVSGHFHKDCDCVISGTRYLCVNELSAIRISKDFKVEK